MITIRSETTADHDLVHALNQAAFESPAEAPLVGMGLAPMAVLPDVQNQGVGRYHPDFHTAMEQGRSLARRSCHEELDPDRRLDPAAPGTLGAGPGKQRQP